MTMARFGFRNGKQAAALAPLTFTEVGWSESTNGTATVPPGAQPGDVLILFEVSQSLSTYPSSTPTNNVGFSTNAVHQWINGGRYTRLVTGFRILTEAPPASYVTMDDWNDQKLMVALRPSRPLVSLTGINNASGSTVAPHTNVKAFPLSINAPATGCALYAQVWSNPQGEPKNVSQTRTPFSSWDHWLSGTMKARLNHFAAGESVAFTSQGASDLSDQITGFLGILLHAA